MGGITFTLPMRYGVQNPPNLDFFSFHAVWTKWGEIINGKDFAKDPRAVISDFPGNSIDILVTGNVKNGQTPEDWLKRNKAIYGKQEPSEYPDFNQIKNANGRVFYYISKEKKYDLEKIYPIVIFCGPVPLEGNDPLSVQCASSFRFKENTYIEYRFRKTYLKDGVKMYNAVKKFIQKMTVE
ncbi:MAG: hypothetical protein GC149_10465 [Gammaproteobacteria bacterium]|nr:hypothetical protein [Gammaproteobacteria bacterium]